MCWKLCCCCFALCWKLILNTHHTSHQHIFTILPTSSPFTSAYSHYSSNIFSAHKRISTIYQNIFTTLATSSLPLTHRASTLHTINSHIVPTYWHIFASDHTSPLHFHPPSILTINFTTHLYYVKYLRYLPPIFTSQQTSSLPSTHHHNPTRIFPTWISRLANE